MVDEYEKKENKSRYKYSQFTYRKTVHGIINRLLVYKVKMVNKLAYTIYTCRYSQLTYPLHSTVSTYKTDHLTGE